MKKAQEQKEAFHKAVQLEVLAEFSMKYEPKTLFKDENRETMKRVFGTEILLKVYD